MSAAVGFWLGWFSGMVVGAACMAFAFIYLLREYVINVTATEVSIRKHDDSEECIN